MDKTTLYKFFYGKATLEEEKQIRAWMEENEEHKKEFFKERKIFDAILVNDKTSSAVREKKNPFYRIPLVRELFKVAALITVTLLVSGIYWSQKKDHEDINTVLNTIVVPPGQRVNLTLADGTNVWLNANTTLKYPSSFKPHERNVFLDGEAYFNVSKKKESPFIVKTNNYQVEVLGTEFNVCAYPNTKLFETSLIEGSVKLALLSDIKNAVLLTPRHRAYEKNGALTVDTLTDYNHFRWTEGLICFKDQSFHTIIHEFERCYGIKIVLNNKQVINHTYTGKFRQSDGIDYALRVLQKNIYFNYDKDDENQVIYIK